MQHTFAADVTFHDAEGNVTGHEAFEARIEALYAGAPPDWAFQAAAPAAEVADLGRATWTFGPPAGPRLCGAWTSASSRMARSPPCTRSSSPHRNQRRSGALRYTADGSWPRRSWAPASPAQVLAEAAGDLVVTADGQTRRYYYADMGVNEPTTRVRLCLACLGC